MKRRVSNSNSGAQVVDGFCKTQASYASSLISNWYVDFII